MTFMTDMTYLTYKAAKLLENRDSAKAGVINGLMAEMLNSC